jgi:hypothetical protein
LLQDRSQQALNTSPLEVMLATLLQAFCQTFDRETPVIFSEGHGREPWVSDIDISDTVGWFTTMIPLHVQAKENMNTVEILKQTKDLRRMIPGNGWPYFASRFLTQEGRQACRRHMPMEVLFNYLGHYQQLERSDSLLQPEPVNSKELVSDVGLDEILGRVP